MNAYYEIATKKDVGIKTELPKSASECSSKVSCKHCTGKSTVNYFMSCEVIKEMPGDKVKIIVFGNRGWKGSEMKSRIRYVKKSRVTEKTILPTPHDNYIMQWLLSQ